VTISGSGKAEGGSATRDRILIGAAALAALALLGAAALRRQRPAA
jgi:hypothetical protein